MQAGLVEGAAKLIGYLLIVLTFNRLFFLFPTNNVTSLCCFSFFHQIAMCQINNLLVIININNLLIIVNIISLKSLIGNK